MIQGLGTIIYKVTDLQKAKLWYTQVFKLQPYFDEPFYVGFNIGGFELGLDPDSPEKIVAGDTVTYWRVDDLQHEYQRLLIAGAQANEAPKSVGDGILVATVLDPFGNKLGFIQNPHFKTEEVR